MSLEWIPEVFPPSGGLSADGFYKLLGRPRLDPLTVLVRETAQNSWDARLRDGLTVEFSIDGWELEPDEQQALVTKVFTDASRVGGIDLASGLAAKPLTGLYISDRNTKGLGGPLHADESDPDGVYDWVDFVLNVGKANTAGQTGGTYGFGKTISYIVSEVNAVVIHSRTMYRGRPQSRLIACAIGSEFTRGKKLCTGRHWWGESRDGAPRPLTGVPADRLAADIGMPGFDHEDLGTTLLIVAPDLAGRTPEQSMTFIGESVTWHLWPKLMSRGEHPPMDIDVNWNGEVVVIPDPVDRPPLHGFAQAFRSLLDGVTESDEAVGTRHDLIRCLRPKIEVGDLVTVPLVQRERAAVEDGYDEEDDESPEPAASILGPCHHVALLRAPELVVDYLAGPPPVEGGTEWAGVFRVRSENDEHFALAEPPTHDSWRPELLPKGQGRTIVKVGLREIRQALDSRWAAVAGRSEGHSPSTAEVADDLAHLVRTVPARGKGRVSKDGPGKPSRASAKVEIVNAGPVVHDGAVATMAQVRVVHRAGTVGTRLSISVGAALDGTATDDDLDPSLELIEASVGGHVTGLSGTTDDLELLGDGPVEVSVVCARGPDITVMFDLRADPIGER